MLFKIHKCSDTFKIHLTNKYGIITFSPSLYIFLGREDEPNYSI